MASSAGSRTPLAELGLAALVVVLVGGPLFFLAEPSVVRGPGTTLEWRTQEGVSAAGAAAARQLEGRILQTCIRQGGYYEGEWVHRPHAPRPHARYASKLMGKHQFIDGTSTLSCIRPLRKKQSTRSIAVIIHNPTFPHGTAERAFRKAHPFNATKDGLEEYLKHNQYDWEPTAPECRLSPFNRTRACLALSKAAGGGHGQPGRVLFVGDSMSFAHALTLLLMLGPDGNEGRWIPKQSAWPETPVCGDVLGDDDKAVLLQFIRNDALYVAREKLGSWAERKELAAMPRGGVDFESSLPWTPYFEEHLPGLVVLNMGLHIHGLEPFKLLLDDTLGYLRRHRDRWQQQQKQQDHNSSTKHAYPRLLFRTTAPGHPECWRYSSPASKAEARALARYEGPYRDEYTWHLIPAFNTYLERRVQEALPAATNETTGGDDRVLLLRAEGITRRRPDGHLVGANKDCLHYHLPGPLDAWTLTLLQTLYTLHGV